VQRPRAAPTLPFAKKATPAAEKCEAVATLLGVPLTSVVKSMVLAIDHADGPTDIVLVLLRADHQLNEVKTRKYLGDYRLARVAEIMQHFGAPPGYLGPVGVSAAVSIVADNSVALMQDFVIGANTAGFHFTGVNWGRDLPEPVTADLRNVVDGDPSPDGAGNLLICRGIEVGHIFQIGTRYAAQMGATYLDETGTLQPFWMGCYGIGVTRLLGAAIEQHADERGMVWPLAMAPFDIVLCPVAYDRSTLVQTQTDSLYTALAERGIDVILDDRGERTGAMLADWELIGIPHRLVIGERNLKQGKVEYQARCDGQPHLLPVEEAVQYIHTRITNPANHQAIRTGS